MKRQVNKQLYPIRDANSRSHWVPTKAVLPRRLSRTLWLATILFFAGYVALFLLLQSGRLWQITSPLQDKWPAFFGWLNAIFPESEQKTDAEIGPGLVALGLYLLLLVGLFGVYLHTLSRVTGRYTVRGSSKGILRLIAGSTAAFLALLFFTREIYAVDVFSYSWFGRIWAVFGANPYIHYPSEYAAQDTTNWLHYLYWQDVPAPYGPLWVLVAGGIAQIADAARGDIVNSVIGHKLLADLAHVANIVLVWKVAGRLHEPRPVLSRWPHPKSRWLALRLRSTRAKQKPSSTNKRQIAATVAYAWNPLLIIEFGISGHNDMLMLTPVLLALLLHLKGHWRWAVLALSLACLVKFTAVIFFPGYLWLLYWQTTNNRGTYAQTPVQARLLRVGQALAIFFTTFAAFYVPLWQGPATLNVLYDDPSAKFFVHSLSTITNRTLPGLLSGFASMLGAGGSAWSPDALAPLAGKLSRWIPLAITGAVAVWQTWRARTLGGMITAWGWVIFAFLTVGLSWYWPWYAAWLVVPAVLSGKARLLNASIVLSFTSLLIYLVGVPLRSVWPDVRLWMGLPVMAIPLLYVGLSVWRARPTRGHVPSSASLQVERSLAENAEKLPSPR